MKPLFLIQARTGSSRFPNKIFEKLYNNFTLIEIVLKRLLLTENVDQDDFVVLTTTNPLDDTLVQYLEHKHVNLFRGNEQNVYNRFKDYLKSLSVKPKYFFRVCSDNPFIEPEFINQMIRAANTDSEFDYLSFQDYKNTPAILTHYGLFVELIKTDSFLAAESLISTPIEEEHVTPIFHSTNYFKKKYLEMPDLLQRDDIRLTFDTREDLTVIKDIFAELNTLDFSYKDVLNVLEKKNNLLTSMKNSIRSNLK
jgi:spore coat polysaccharide biosynthesis protein SpsF (cytidylyltransferase family)